MRKIRWFLVVCFGLFVFLPCTVASLFQRDVSFLLQRTNSAEKYLPAILYKSIDSEMHTETLKAQAVLVRSNLIKALEENQVTYKELQEEYSLIEETMDVENLSIYENLVWICQETEGEVVKYNSKVCFCPFFYSSNGTTREAFSFFEDGSYPYLVAVPSHRDEESSSYITYHHFTMEEFQQKMNELSGNTFQNQIDILEKDQSEYITWLKVGEKIVGGEVFRNKLGLSSASFSIEQEEEGIRISCKGRGHGFGFSQYGANAMAMDGKGYKELIDYYFHNITIENVYRFL